jgi:hypothetical protein
VRVLLEPAPRLLYLYGRRPVIQAKPPFVNRKFSLYARGFGDGRPRKVADPRSRRVLRRGLIGC